MKNKLEIFIENKSEELKKIMSDNEIANFLEKNELDGIYDDNFLENKALVMKFSEIFICMYFQNKGEKVRLKTKVNKLEKEIKKVTNDETNIVFVNKRSLEIFSKTCDKAVAANFLLQKDGLTLKDAVSFGDGVNDYDLITRTGLGFAMKNSIYRLMEKLSDIEIIESNENDRMAKKVREIFDL